MALAHSPGIVTSGLVFAYDMNNVTKSFRGQPATNLYGANLGDVNSVTAWGKPTAGTATITDAVVTNLGSFNGNRIWRVTVSAGTLASYSSFRDCLPAGFDATYGTTRRLNFKVFMEKGSITALSSHTGGGNSGYSAGNWTDVDPNTVTGCEIKSGWKQFDADVSGNYPSGHCVGVAILTSDIQFLVTEMAVTNTSFRVPFTSLSRSTSQALVDQTGRSTVTASNFTYNSDNTFDYNYANSSHVRIPLATAFNKTVGTMNFWIYPTRYNGGNGYFVNRDDDIANAADWFWIGPYSGTFYFRLGNGSTCCDNDLSFANVATVIPLNTWTNMCFTWQTGGTAAIYKNGSLLTSRSIGTVPATNPASFGRIGLGHDNADDYFHGRMPNVAIYNRVLTAAEILQNFNAIRGRYGI